MKWLSYFWRLIMVELDISRESDGQNFQWCKITLEIVSRADLYSSVQVFLTPQYRLGVILASRNFGVLIPTTTPVLLTPLPSPPQKKFEVFWTSLCSSFENQYQYLDLFSLGHVSGPIRSVSLQARIQKVIYETEIRALHNLYDIMLSFLRRRIQCSL